MQPRDVFNKGYKNDCAHGDLDHKVVMNARVSKNVKHPPAEIGTWRATRISQKCRAAAGTIRAMLLSPLCLLAFGARPSLR
jgi:hypothetical protein